MCDQGERAMIINTAVRLLYTSCGVAIQAGEAFGNDGLKLLVLMPYWAFGANHVLIQAKLTPDDNKFLNRVQQKLSDCSAI